MTTNAAFLEEVENFFISSELPTIPALKIEVSPIVSDSLTRRSKKVRKVKNTVDDSVKRELERMKDRIRRRKYRERKQIERENLLKKIETLTRKLEETKKDKHRADNSTWKIMAQTQRTARLSAEAMQRNLSEAIDARAILVQDFHRLVQERLTTVDNFPGIENQLLEERNSTRHQQKRVQVESLDAKIFAAYIQELDAVYSRTDETLAAWGLDSTEENWDTPLKLWSEDARTGNFQFRGKFTMPYDFQDICEYRWKAAHLIHRQESRELYDEVSDPKNTVALKFRVTTHLNSGKIATALQRVVFRRYEEDERMVLVWRLFTEGEGAFDGMHSDETGWGVATPAVNSLKMGTMIRTCVRNVPLHFGSKTEQQPVVRQFNNKLLEWGLENNEMTTTGLQKLVVT